MKEAIIVDLEDTLSDTDHRKHLWPEQGSQEEAFNAWNEGLVDDPPTSLIPIIQSLSKKYEIIICTAKPIKYRTIIYNWLKKELGWEPAFVFMRSEAEMNLSSPEYKNNTLSHIIRELKFRVILAIDDRKDVCNMNINRGIYTWLYEKNTIIIPPGIKKLLDEINHFTMKKTDYSKPPNAGDILINAAKIFKAKDKEYVNSYHEFGDLCLSLFPEGIELKTAEEMNRWAVLELMLVKIQRYCHHFLEGGHKDSLDDLIVYSSMLQELDNLTKEAK